MQQAMSSQHGDELNPLDTTGLCLLSLDGGGVRGLSTLYILKSIMDQLNHQRKTAELPIVKPCEVFDLIGGTSTGGLIAIMLGRLEMDVDECIIAYTNLAEAVFSQKKSRLPFSLKGKVKARFDSSKLENAIRETIRKSGSSETELFHNGTERGCRTFVCTADQNTKSIVRLRSYALPDESNVPATIWQAALATSAATTFFDPVRIGNRMFADGGLGANNPVDEVEGEAANIWCSQSGDLKPLVKCFISIGTGDPGIKAFEESMFKFLGKTIVEIATETDKTEKLFIAKWRKHFDDNRYFRFNVDQGLQSVGLDEYAQQGVMESATERYLIHQAQKNRVRDCIQNLRLKQNQTDTSFGALMNEHMVRSLQPQSVDVAFWNVPFDRNRHFTGREAQLVEAEDNLFAEACTTKCAIWGLGGVGKTQLLLELVHRIRDKCPHRSIIWIPATNIESLHHAYLDVARNLGTTELQNEKDDVERLVQSFLSKASSGQWLLVFDNADNDDMWFSAAGSTDRLIDRLPKSKQGSIVFTTRDRKLAVKLAQQNIIEVPQMDMSTARHLLRKSLVSQTLVDCLDDTRALLEELTCLPLAIIQAAAYINKNSIAIADYVSLLADQEEDVIDLLSEDFEDCGRYRNAKNPVATTWDVPQSLLPPGPSRKRKIDAIGTLDAYSFIRRRPADSALDAHRLVHLATRNWLRGEGKLAQWTKRVVTRLRDVFPSDDHQNRIVCRRYLTHAQYALNSNLVDKYAEDRIKLAWSVGACLDSDGRWKEAVDLFELVLEAERRLLGNEHCNTLVSMARLASAYWSQGRWKEAEDLEVVVVETRKRVLGDEHLSTLTCMANLAVTYLGQDRLKEAKCLGVLVLETRKRVLGDEHPDTLNCIANLAVIYSIQGRLKEAESLGALMVETRKRLLGDEHPETLTSMENLSTTYHRQGRWKEALKLLEDCATLQTRVLGADHFETLNSVQRLLEWQTDDKVTL